MKNIKIGFSAFGSLIVTLQLLPNILWALRPPVPDPLAGNASSVPFIEVGEHALQAAMVILLVFLVNKVQHGFPRNAWSKATIISVALYWFFWALYFSGVQTDPVIYAMVIFPAIAFFSAGAAQKIWPISAVSTVFLVFHFLVAYENFPFGV